MRNFLVFVRAAGDIGEATVCVESVTEGDDYIRKSDIEGVLLKDGFDRCVITNIIELSDKDLKQFLS